MSVVKAIRGAMVDLTDDPAEVGEQAVRYFDDGIMLIKDGIIQALDHADKLLNEIDASVPLEHYDDHLIIPGMIDTHIHFPQMEMIAAYGEQLLTWLTTYTFPTEKQFACENYGKAMSGLFLDELLKNGTTTALVFGTVHPESVEEFFAESKRRKLRMIAGRVMMDRNCPDDLQETPQQAYRECKQLIEKWHGVDRLQYAVTPRFAPTSSPEQLAVAKQLLDEYPGLYLHTHLAENLDECAWVKELFPEADDYLGVYEAAGLVTRRSVFAHGIHLSDRELGCLADEQAAIAHCPTSNLFIGSGLFNLKRCQQHNVQVGMGTDVGAGTSFSLFQTYNEAYKVQQLQANSLSAFEGLYLNTIGGARALDLDDRICNFNPGNEADFLVLDKGATPLLKLRLNQAKSLHDLLFSIMMLADDRAVYKTYIMGDVAHCRDHAVATV